MKKVKIRWKFTYLTLVFVLLITALTPVGEFVASSRSNPVVHAEPANPQEERGIWVDKFRIVLYNNVLKAENSSSETVEGLDGQEYPIPGNGELFVIKSIADSMNGDSIDQVYSPNAADKIFPRPRVYEHQSGCATLTVPSGQASRATLDSTCTFAGNTTLSGVSVALEQTNRANTIAFYDRENDVYTSSFYISGINKSGYQDSESDDVNLDIDVDGVFAPTPGDDDVTATGGLSGDEERYLKCGNNDEGNPRCYAVTGDPGEADSTWIRFIGNDEVVQVRRSWMENTFTAKVTKTRYLSGGRASGTASDALDAATDMTADYQTAEAQKGMFRDLFETSQYAAEAKRIATFCWAQAYGPISGFDAISVGGKSALETVIDTLVIGQSGPFYECMYDGFTTDENTSQGLKDLFAQISSVKSPSNTRAPTPQVDGGDCGGGIPIISDLACYLVKWAFNVIYEIFTGVIDSMTNPPDVLNDQGGMMDQIWASLRNIANVFFLIAFLLVIFQYITNVNVADAYFVKKFIPRLIIAVVLVQASGWIAREMLYFFDDLGQSIQPILFSAADIPADNSFQIGGGAATVAAFASPALIGMLAVFAIVFLVLLLIAIAVLTLRYVAILILAILAPVVFGMLAIPQLEGTFKKWLKTYVTLLAMYPIIMAILASSTVVAKALSSGGLYLQLMALTVQFVPFVILPFTFKMAGGMMGKLSGALTSLAKKGAKGAWNNSGTKAGLDRFKGMRKQSKDAKADEKVSKRLNKYRNPDGGDNRFARTGRRLGRRSLMRGMDDAAVDRYASGFEDSVKKRKTEEAEHALAAKLSKTTDRDSAVRLLNGEYADAMRSGDIYGASAAYKGLVDQKDVAGLEKIQSDANSGIYDTAAFRDATGGMSATAVYNQQQGGSYGDLSGFAPHLRGDMGGKDLKKERADNLRKMSNDQLSGIKPEAWAAWADDGPSGVEEAARRFNAILTGGGGAASKLSPEARDKILAKVKDPADRSRIESIIDAP